MNFNNHSNLEGQHAFLGASKYHWINYSEDKVADAYSKFLATQKGTVLHAFAAQCISLGQKLPKSQKTLNMYVNDAIGYKMTPEQTLFYSENCFGTADSISYRSGLLRIHDLKTGVIPAHMEQLMIYAALFCLEYKVKPADIDMELRIYQNNEVLYHNPTAEDIVPIMDKIITFALMQEVMVYGTHYFEPANDGTTIPTKYSVCNSQLALMRLNPRMIKIRETYWLQNVVSSATFAIVGIRGSSDYGLASYSFGVRPYGIIG